jgi:hypothetical protein
MEGISNTYQITIFYNFQHTRQYNDKLRRHVLLNCRRVIVKTRFRQYGSMCFSNLVIHVNAHWLLLGGFNFYLSAENRNRDGANFNDMFTFNEVISHFGLVELNEGSSLYRLEQHAVYSTFREARLVLHDHRMDSYFP